MTEEQLLHLYHENDYDEAMSWYEFRARFVHLLKPAQEDSREFNHELIQEQHSIG